MTLDSLTAMMNDAAKDVNVAISLTASDCLHLIGTGRGIARGMKELLEKVPMADTETTERKQAECERLIAIFTDIENQMDGSSDAVAEKVIEQLRGAA